MQLKELRIRLMDYGPFDGSYVGEVEFKDEHSTLKINISPELSSKVLEICAECLVTQAKQTASLMSAKIIEQVKDKTKLLI